MTSPFGRVVEDCRRLIQELNTVKCYLLRDALIWRLMTAHELARLSYSFPISFLIGGLFLLKQSVFYWLMQVNKADFVCKKKKLQRTEYK